MSTESEFVIFASHGTGDFLVIETPQMRVTLNYPRSWLARRIWRWFGFVWEKP